MSSDWRPPVKFVLFADGTGNAFTTQESNVWRLYEALDRTRTDQVAYYIKGVGTAGWRPLAVLDGVTGIGVPSNVRKLYRFLCWNWRPGDEIYVFGFSRGAFTARTLAALIASQGLLPAEIAGDNVSHGEMQRNVMSAWREYRRAAVGYRSLPTIWIARWIRDFVLAVYHTIFLHRSYNKVRNAMDEGRKDVPIKFLGLFDTVEAFGVPIEELRTAIDWTIWPISFRNRKLPRQVECARHALSLDDERTTFHPIRIDHEEGSERVKEVWFAGVHSDVGGGYPDGTLSYVPLIWMVEQIREDLRFQPGSFEHFQTYQSAIGPRHDSRSGAAVLYRYSPRPVGADKKVNGGAPVVHLGVVERMLHGCDDYAPIMLPASAKVRVQSGQVMALTEQDTREAMKSAYEGSARQQGKDTGADAEAFVRMRPPNDKMVQLTLDTVWWRRAAYVALFASVVLLAAWPWVSRKVVGVLKGPTDSVSVGDTSALDIIRWLDYGAGAVIGPVAGLLQDFLPSYADPWLNIAIYYPFATTVVLALVVITWTLNGYLRDRIQERARLAWYRPGRTVVDRKAGLFLPVGRFMRLYGWPLRFLFIKIMLPAVFLVAVFGLVLLAAGRSYFNWRAGTGEICQSAGTPAPLGDEPVAVPAVFDISKLCWASGYWAEKGRKYRIWIDAKDSPWFDRTIMSGVTGFQLNSAGLIAALPLRRSYAAAWLQPVVRIGAKGDAELPLQAINAMPAADLPRPRHPLDIENEEKQPVRVEDTPEFAANADLRSKWPTGKFDRIPEAALPGAREIWRKQGLPDLLVAEFIAPESGEVFLYVNDAIQVIPFSGPFERYYNNNTGAAKITLQRLPPPLPQSAPQAK